MEEKSKLQLIGEIAQANNKNLELIEEINEKEDEIERLHSIIKEVREYITTQQLHKFQDTTGGLTWKERELLKILDKAGDEK